MTKVRKVFALLLIVAVVLVGLAGCKKKSETPDIDQPAEEALTEEAPTEKALTEEALTEEALTEEAPTEKDVPSESPSAEHPK